MNLIANYQQSLQAIYDHIGFKEDWTVFPIEDATRFHWHIVDLEVHFYDSLEAHESEDGMHSYTDELLTHRFYQHSVFVGQTFTGILVDTHTDGNRFLKIFLNKNQIV